MVRAHRLLFSRITRPVSRHRTLPSTTRGVLALFSALGAACAPPAATTTAPSAPAPSSYVRTPADEAFLDTLQRRTFDWFWETTDARTGLTPDRYPSRTFSSIAAVGFGLTAYGIGAERGYVTREAAAARTLNTLRYFWLLPQGPDSAGTAGYRGFYYHFLDFDRGLRFKTVELSTIDTALLLAGVLFCQQYFDRDNDAERAIRAYADSLYRRVEWDWARNGQSLISMGWEPGKPFGEWYYKGYNEAMLLYVLALGSPTHPITPDAWKTYTSTYTWATFYGQPHVNFAPLFGHQYSHSWIDFRGIRDEYMRARGIDYFENSRRATLAQRAYAAANPGRWKDYSAEIWGITASDGPADTTFVIGGTPRRFYTYAARGVAATEIRDDGTLAAWASGASIAFAPEIVLPTLRAMRQRYGELIFTKHGFVDAFNPTFDFPGAERAGRVVPGRGWVDSDYLGIDQGPMLAMIENYRTGLVWREMRESPYIRRGLERAGFTGGWLTAEKATP